MKRTALLLSLLVLAGSAAAQAPAPAPATPGATPDAAPGAAGAEGGRRGAPGAPARPQNPATPYDFNDHPGWTSMFDGKTLKDWDGPMDVWRVENGTITASESASNPVGSVYLYWTGGKVKNFEFKTEIKTEGAGSNSGIQFRAIRLGKIDKKNSEWESRGYQADWTDNGGAVGSLIECCMGPRRGLPPRPGNSARRGFVMRTALGEGQHPTVLATTGDPADLLKFYRMGDWNEIHLIVRGGIMMYIVNGHLMSVLIEDNPDPYTDMGEIAVQLEGRGDIKVSFRNMWIKQLP